MVSEWVIISNKTFSKSGNQCTVLIPETSKVKADGQSLCFVRVELVDSEGNPVPNINVRLIASVEGQSVLAGFGSGNPKTTDNYTSGECSSYEGKALVVVRAGREKGEAILKVSSENLKSASATFYIQ